MGLVKIGRRGERKNDAPTGGETFAPLGENQLGISEEAAQLIKQLIEQQGHPLLRIAVRGGGCSGFSIHYEFTEVAEDRELTILRPWRSSGDRQKITKSSRRLNTALPRLSGIKIIYSGE